MSLSGHSLQLPESQEDHPQCPDLVQEMLPCPSGSRQDGLNPRKSGLESDIHCSTQSPSGRLPPERWPLACVPACVWSLSQVARSSGSGGHRIASLDPQGRLPAGETNQDGRASSALSELLCSQLCWASGRSFCSRAWCSGGCAAVRCRRQASAGERHEEGRPWGGVTTEI